MLMAGRPRYPVLVCLLADRDCPHDEAFEHRHYYGCVPRDFSERTGRSKTHSQTRVAGQYLLGYRYLWDGGCDARESETPE